MNLISNSNHISEEKTVESEAPVITKFDEEFGMGIPIFYKGEQKQSATDKIKAQPNDTFSVGVKSIDTRNDLTLINPCKDAEQYGQSLLGTTKGSASEELNRQCCNFMDYIMNNVPE